MSNTFNPSSEKNKNRALTFTVCFHVALIAVLLYGTSGFVGGSASVSPSATVTKPSAPAPANQQAAKPSSGKAKRAEALQALSSQH